MPPFNGALGFHPVNQRMEIHTNHLGSPPPAPCALQQHPCYGRALTAMGAKVHQLLATDGTAIIAQVQVIERRFGPARLIWLPRGPVWAPDTSAVQKGQVLAMLPRHLGNRAFWLGAPENASDAALFTTQRFRPLLTPQYVAELDLALPPDTRLRMQHGKWRNRLRHAQKSCLRVINRPIDMARDQPLLAQEASQRRAKRYSALPPAFTHAWVTRNKQAARLFLAKDRSDTLAWILILLHAPTATYHIGFTGAEGRACSAHNLLLWQAANWLSDRGYTRLDLGNVDTENTPGLARFKIASGATVRALGPTLLRLPGLRRHRLVCNDAA